jgi:isoleucyl-tRNA synthetase
MCIENAAPFKQVLTHGFVVDGLGRKMSKSLGNVISPQDIIKRSGADVLRLWVSSCDYESDIRASDEILIRTEDAYRKIRNTFKFILGNLSDFNPEKNSVEYVKLFEIDKWALSKLEGLLEDSTAAYETFQFHKVYRAAYDFCTIELSSFYLDILKDTLYTFHADSLKRRSAQTALYNILSALIKILAPILVFTCEEAWSCMPKFSGEPDSVHMAEWPKANKERKSKKLEENWQSLIELRARVLKAIEEKRTAGVIGNSLQAKVTIITGANAGSPLLHDFLQGYLDQLAGIFIVSQVELKKDTALSEDAIFIVDKASGQKCQRCWNYRETVGKDSVHPEICDRCIEAIKQ